MENRDQLDQESRKTEKKLLATEAALLLLLHRKIRNLSLPGNPLAARATLVQQIARLYLSGRVAARTAGILRLDSELKAADPQLAGLVLPDTQEGTADRFGVALGVWALLDGRRAMRAAGGFGDRWYQLVQEQVRAGNDNAYETAFRLAEPRLQTGVITENADAFNQARRDALDQHQGVLREADLVRVWNATLDKRTCGKCSDMDGKWVLVGERFPEGEPGSVHPRCRCRDDLIPRAWVDSLDLAA